MDNTNIRPSSDNDQTEVKKQRVKKEDNKVSDITDHFKPVSRKHQKVLKSVLKQNKEGEKQPDLTKLVNTTTKKTYQYIVFDIPPETDSVLEYMKVLIEKLGLKKLFYV